MTKFKISIILLIFSAATVIFSLPVHADDLMAVANKSYEQGDFDRALESYSALAKQGFEGPSLYYNLGNSYFKKGERGNAILWYERALRLSPRDSDVQFNLSLARSHLKDEEPDAIESLIFFFSDRELGAIVLILSWIFFGILGAKSLQWIASESWPNLALWMSGGLLIVAGVWFGGRIAMGNKPYAVVVSPPGEVRNGPGTEYAVGFTIPEGSRVVVLDRRPEWLQVGVPQQGLKGWMPSKDVDTIILPKLS